MSDTVDGIHVTPIRESVKFDCTLTVEYLPESAIYIIGILLDIQSIGRLKTCSIRLNSVFRASSPFWFFWVSQHGCPPLFPAQNSICPCKIKKKSDLFTWCPQHNVVSNACSSFVSDVKKHECNRFVESHVLCSCRLCLNKKCLKTQDIPTTYSRCSCAVVCMENWYDLVRYRTITAGGSWRLIQPSGRVTYSKVCQSFHWIPRSDVFISVPYLVNSLGVSSSIGKNERTYDQKNEEDIIYPNRSIDILMSPSVNTAELRVLEKHFNEKVNDHSLVHILPATYSSHSSIRTLEEWICKNKMKTDSHLFNPNHYSFNDKEIHNTTEISIDLHNNNNHHHHIPSGRTLRCLYTSSSPQIKSEHRVDKSCHNHNLSSPLSHGLYLKQGCNKSNKIFNLINTNPEYETKQLYHNDTHPFIFPIGDQNIVFDTSPISSTFIPTRPIGPKILWDIIRPILYSLGIKVLLGSPQNTCSICVNSTKDSTNCQCIQSTPVYLSFSSSTIKQYLTQQDLYQTTRRLSSLSETDTDDWITTSWNVSKHHYLNDASSSACCPMKHIGTQETHYFKNRRHDDMKLINMSVLFEDLIKSNIPLTKLHSAQFEKDSIWGIADCWSAMTEAKEQYFTHTSPIISPLSTSWSAGYLPVQKISILPLNEQKSTNDYLKTSTIPEQHCGSNISKDLFYSNEKQILQMVMRAGHFSCLIGCTLVLVNPSLSLLIFLGSMVGPLGRILCVLDHRCIPIRSIYTTKESFGLEELSLSTRQSNSPKIFSWCTAALYDWIAFWLGNMSIIWTSNCQSKSEIFREIDEASGIYYSPFVSQYCLNMNTKQQQQHFFKKEFTCIPISSHPSERRFNVRNHLSHFREYPFHFCCSSCTPNHLTFLTLFNRSTDYIKNHSVKTNDTEISQLSHDLNITQLIAKPSVIVIDFPAHMCVIPSDELDNSKTIKIITQREQQALRRRNAQLLSQTRRETIYFFFSTINAITDFFNLNRSEIDIVGIIARDEMNNLSTNPMFDVTDGVWEYLCFRETKFIRSISEIHQFNQGFAQALNFILQSNPFPHILCYQVKKYIQESIETIMKIDKDNLSTFITLLNIFTQTMTVMVDKIQSPWTWAEGFRFTQIFPTPADASFSNLLIFQTFIPTQQHPIELHIEAAERVENRLFQLV